MKKEGPASLENDFFSRSFFFSTAPIALSLSPGSHLVRALSLCVFFSFSLSLSLFHMRQSHPRCRCYRFRNGPLRTRPEENERNKTTLARSLAGILRSFHLISPFAPSSSLSPTQTKHHHQQQRNNNSMLSALVAAMATAARSSVSSSGSRTMATTTSTTTKQLVARRFFSAASSSRPSSSSLLPGGCPSAARAMPSALRAYAADAAVVSRLKKNAEKRGEIIFQRQSILLY